MMEILFTKIVLIQKSKNVYNMIIDQITCQATMSKLKI